MKAHHAVEPEKVGMTQAQAHAQPKFTCRWESFKDNSTDLIPIFIKAWDEDPIKNNTDLDIDWKTYFVMENADRLKLFIIRNSGKIIGFATFIIGKSLLCNQFMASTDTHYILPEYRKTRFGLGIFREAKREFKKLKIDKLFFHEHDLSGRMPKIFKFLGAKKAQTFWEIDLDE